MKTYKNLREKIIDKDNIRLAHINAKKDKSFYKEVQMVDANLDYYVNEIHNMLKNKTYIIKANDYKTSIIFDK